MQCYGDGGFVCGIGFYDFFDQVDVQGGLCIDVFVGQDYVFGLVFIYELWQCLCVVIVVEQVDGCFGYGQFGVGFGDVDVVCQCVFQVVVYCKVIDGGNYYWLCILQCFECGIEVCSCFVGYIVVVIGKGVEICFCVEEFWFVVGDDDGVYVCVGV